MKKTLSLLLIVLLVSPAFASWLPHSVIHSLHSNNIEHLATRSHHHSAHAHNHVNHDSLHRDNHHPIHIDVVTFFSDYLNVDLQRTSLDNVDIPSADVDDIDFITRVTGIAPHHYDEPPPSASHIFDNRKMFGSSNIPLYLSTQRLRI